MISNITAENHPDTFRHLHQRKNKHGTFHLRSLTNITEDALIHDACGSAPGVTTVCPDEKEGTNQLLSSWRCNPLTMPVSINRSAESILLTAR